MGGQGARLPPLVARRKIFRFKTIEINIASPPIFGKLPTTDILWLFSLRLLQTYMRGVCHSLFRRSLSDFGDFVKQDFLGYTFFFYKKLGSGRSTKSFLIQQEILSILVIKDSKLVSYF